MAASTSSLLQHQRHRAPFTSSSCSSRPGPVPRPCQLHAATAAPQRSVLARGILDAYRREQAAKQKQSRGLLGSIVAQLPQQSPLEQIIGDPNASADDAPCPVECVVSVSNNEELQQIIDAAAESHSLVVIDFYKTACGACKYIMPGFVKMCRAAGQGVARPLGQLPPVVFVKHNVFDDEESRVTDLAKQYNIRAVPKFVFVKQGSQVESFGTRERTKVAEAILRHAEPGSVEMADWH